MGPASPFQAPNTALTNCNIPKRIGNRVENYTDTDTPRVKERTREIEEQQSQLQTTRRSYPIPNQAPATAVQALFAPPEIGRQETMESHENEADEAQPDVIKATRDWLEAMTEQLPTNELDMKPGEQTEQHVRTWPTYGHAEGPGKEEELEQLAWALPANKKGRFEVDREGWVDIEIAGQHEAMLDEQTKALVQNQMEWVHERAGANVTDRRITTPSPSTQPPAKRLDTGKKQEEQLTTEENDPELQSATRLSIQIDQTEVAKKSNAITDEDAASLTTVIHMVERENQGGNAIKAQQEALKKIERQQATICVAKEAQEKRERREERLRNIRPLSQKFEKEQMAQQLNTVPEWIRSWGKKNGLEGDEDLGEFVHGRTRDDREIIVAEMLRTSMGPRLNEFPIWVYSKGQNTPATPTQPETLRGNTPTQMEWGATQTEISVAARPMGTTTVQPQK